jgi:hypothetical protein
MIKVCWAGIGKDVLVVDFGHGMTATVNPFFAGVGAYEDLDGPMRTVTYGGRAPLKIHMERGKDAVIYSGMLSVSVPHSEAEALALVLDGTLPLAPDEVVDLATEQEVLHASA